MVRNSEGKTGFFIFVILLGAIGGKFLGDILGNSSKYLAVLKNVYTIGTTKPFTLDLKVLVITFGLNFNINIMSIAGIILAIMLYKKLRK